MADLAPRHRLTTQARALLEIADQWIARAEKRPPPFVTDDEKLDARARFETALALVRRVAACETVRDAGHRLPAWPVKDDPRIAAIEEIRTFARVDEDELEARTMVLAAEDDARLQPLLDYVAALPNPPRVAMRPSPSLHAQVKTSRAVRARLYDRGPIDRIYETVRVARPTDRLALEAALLEEHP